MAYEMVMPYHLHMPSYFLETFTEYPYVLPAEFGWSDLGSWGSLHSLLPKDERNNAVVGENVRMYECNNCIVHTPHLKQAVIQGLDGYIIAEKEGTLLICRLAEEQRIKEFSKI